MRLIPVALQYALKEDFNQIKKTPHRITKIERNAFRSRKAKLDKFVQLDEKVKLQKCILSVIGIIYTGLLIWLNKKLTFAH